LETAAHDGDATAIRRSLLSLNIGYQVRSESTTDEADADAEPIDSKEDDQDLRKATRVRFPSLNPSSQRRTTPTAAAPPGQRRVVL
jgi:hypothetical protein